VRGATFAGAFQGGCWPERTSEYRISRWETAAVRVPRLAIRRYEQLLALPTRSLVPLVDTVLRYCAPTPGQGTLAGPRLDVLDDACLPRLEQLMELARSDDTVTGADWDELTGYLAASPRHLITPRSAWSDLAQRLLVEMTVSDGVAWMQRHEAFNRLLTHPVGQPSAIAACASMAADRTSQVFIEAVSVLDISSHPDASRHVLHQLTNPVNARAQYGALLASVRKIRYGHFDEPQLRRLAPVVHDMLGNESGYLDARQLATELLRRLPTDRAAKPRSPMAPAPVPSLRPDSLLVDRLVNAALARMPRELPTFHDRLLPAFIGEMLYSPVLDERLYAAILLSGTPYRTPIATALCTEITRGSTLRNRDVSLASAIIEGLRILGGPEQRPVIERLTTADGLPPTVTLAATRAIGHIAGRSSDHYWRTAIQHHSRLWYRRRAEASLTALHGLVYGLGQARHTALLRSLRDDTRAPLHARSAASWWLDLPRAIYNGALR
jgi:hypothetical protein